jgi:hypothetical protein
LVENYLLATNFTTIPRDKNYQDNSLAMEASSLRPPNVYHLRYEVEVLHISSIQDNVKHLKIFEDDQQIVHFLEMANELPPMCIDDEEE